jgi:hypothetical protein
VQAVFEDLADPKLKFDAIAAPLRLADEVVVAGGAGAVVLADAVPMWLPNRSTHVSAVCDDCVIPFKLSPPHGSPVHIQSNGTTRHREHRQQRHGADAVAAECTDDAACPPTTSLPAASTPWNLTAGLCGASHPPWRCLFADRLLVNFASRVFVLNAQVSTAALRMYSASLTTASGRQFAKEYAMEVRTAAKLVANSYADGCVDENSTATSIISPNYFYFSQLNCTQQGRCEYFLCSHIACSPFHALS